RKAGGADHLRRRCLPKQRKRKEGRWLACPHGVCCAGAQNCSRSANWIWRAEPKSPVGNRVLPITPKDLLVAVRTGLPKLGWLKISNISVRNCRLSRSVIFVSLVTEKSVLINPGPVMVSRPRLPGWQEPGTIG